MRKARAVAHGPRVERPVIAADTAVVLDGQLYGKPRDVSEAGSHLERLSGRGHVVFSAVVLVEGESQQSGIERTTVKFRRLDERTIDWYLASGEWRGRAGAYAIQGRGAALVERVEGDYWNVVGLPVSLLLEMAPWLIAST